MCAGHSPFSRAPRSPVVLVCTYDVFSSSYLLHEALETEKMVCRMSLSLSSSSRLTTSIGLPATTSRSGLLVRPVTRMQASVTTGPEEHSDRSLVLGVSCAFLSPRKSKTVVVKISLACSISLIQTWKKLFSQLLVKYTF